MECSVNYTGRRGGNPLCLPIPPHGRPLLVARYFISLPFLAILSPKTPLSTLLCNSQNLQGSTRLGEVGPGSVRELEKGRGIRGSRESGARGWPGHDGMVEHPVVTWRVAGWTGRQGPEHWSGTVERSGGLGDRVGGR